METRHDIHIMVQVAQMYYIDGLTQEKIAQKLGVSRSSVSMILTEARDFGIVDIRIKNPQANNERLSKKMVDKFGLEKCYVIPFNVKLKKMLTKIVASQGAVIVGQEIKNHSSLGVAWGTTCYECMSAFRNTDNLYDVQVVPLIGGTNRIASEYQLNEMVRMMAEKLQGLPLLMYAPALAESIEDKHLYMKGANMQPIVEKWETLDVALISVGAPPEYYDSKLLYHPEEAINEFEDDPKRAVGDICARRFNMNGEFFDNAYNHKIIGIGEDELREVGKVVCVAAGDHKVLSIIGALRADIIDILVTDETTAARMLRLVGD